MSFRARVLSVLLLLAAVVPLGARAQASGAAVHGAVVDADDAIIPGATVTLTPSAGSAQVINSKSDGTYSFRGVASGTYSLTVTAPGFAPYIKQGVRIGAGQDLALDTKMATQEIQQVVNVTTNTTQLSVDPEQNASSTVISGAALDALSDDPDELSSELTALAGPSAGPNGGQIYIDGFTGGQLPPKSSIREIRINQNPFSAQYDQLGYGRIEVFTKPGTDKFHGNASFQYGGKFLNTSTPFLGAANSQPDYHTIFLMGSVTGPVRKGMSFTVSGSHRDIKNNDISNPTSIYSSGPTSTTLCSPGDQTCGSYAFPTTARAISNPQTRSDVSPRIDVALGAKNTLTVRYQYEQGSNSNNLSSSIGLPTTATNSTSYESTIQVSDTQLISSKIINETRFEYQATNSTSSPVSTGPTISVSGIFTGGGSSIGNNLTTGNHIELQNYTSIQMVKNFIRIGGRLRTSGENLGSNGGANGQFLYSYLLDPCTDPTVTTKPTNCATGVTTKCAAANATISSYQCSIPFQFTQTKINSYNVTARQTDLGLYVEDDWKAKNNLTISYGMRLEAQNYIDSAHDFAPRLSVAYGIPRKNGKTTTVVRAGFGIFYNRFQLGKIINEVQNNGTNQNDLIYSLPGTTCTPSNFTPCTTNAASLGKSTIDAYGPGLRSAYTVQSAITIEQQVGKYASVSSTYLNAQGEHQFLTRDIPVGSAFVFQDQAGGVFRQNQINTNVNIRTPKGITIFGFYAASWANSNISGITNPYVSSVDYGRAAFAVRSRMTVGGSIPLPFKITASPLLFANSGSPYNITTGVDENADSQTNDRPAFLPGASSASCTNAASFQTPAASKAYVSGENYTEIPVNYCTGPANVTINLRLARTFGFGPKTEAALAAAARAQQGGGQGGGGAFGGGGGPGGGGGGARGGGGGGGARGGGGGGGGAANTGRKYNLTIGAQAQNLFNEIPYGTPTSVLTSSKFGIPTTLQGMPFASANAVRRITLQANFSF